MSTYKLFYVRGYSHRKNECTRTLITGTDEADVKEQFSDHQPDHKVQLVQLIGWLDNDIYMEI